jgi:hypothetical protein
MIIDPASITHAGTVATSAFVSEAFTPLIYHSVKRSIVTQSGRQQPRPMSHGRDDLFSKSPFGFNVV